MSILLRTKLVEYECSCGLFHPLSELYVCRQCMILKCAVCAFQYVDSCFCRACFESVASTDVKQNKNKCPSCYKCPVCEMVLTVRSTSDKQRLLCTNCKYTSLDAGFEDSENQTFNKVKNPNEKFYDELKAKMKELSHYEKMELERNDKRRRSNMNYCSDKFGIHAMLSRKKMDVNPPPSPLGETVVRDGEIEELSLEEILKPVDPLSIPTYAQQLKSLEKADHEKLYPNNLPLSSRRSLRCNTCDRGLVRSDYNPAAVTFRVKAFANTYIPDIKIVRPIKLFKKAESPLFLLISNTTEVPVKIRIHALPVAESDDSYVECQNEPIECTVQAANIVADVNEQFQEPSHGGLVFKKRHRAAIHLRVKPKCAQEYNYLLLNFTYEFEGNPFPTSEASQLVPQNTKVKLNLGPSKDEITEEDLTPNHHQELNRPELSWYYPMIMKKYGVSL